MVRTEIQNELYPDCPIRNILARISDKWSILVLFTLNQSTLMRFNALQKKHPRHFTKNADYDFENS